MAWEIGDAVLSGEVVNTCPNQVHGWLRLAGLERPLYLNLTGNLSADLAGRQLNFSGAGRGGAELPRLSRQQVGPTGDMTLLERGRLLLEWHGQNGLMLCRIPLADWNLSEPAGEGGCQGLPRHDGEGGLFAQIESLAGLPAVGAAGAESWEEQFDILDQMLEDTEGEEPIRSLLSPRLELPPAESLDPRQLQLKVKEVLAHLAVLGVCLEMCHHFTAADAYRVLHKVVAEDKLHPQSPASGYVMHYLTFEHCQTCLAEEATWVQAESSP